MSNINVSGISIGKFAKTLEAHLRTKQSVMIHGSPGIGKSEVIKEYCKEKGYEIVVRMLSQMQPSDFVIPYVDKEKNITRWAHSDWIAELPRDKESVLFLDELPAAPSDVQVAAYQILNEREIAGLKLPEKCLVVAAGNRVSDNAISSEMGTAAADRLTHFNIKVNSDEWIEWATKKGIHPYVLSYIKIYSDRLVDEENLTDLVRVSPRSWVAVSKYLYYAEQNNVEKETLQSLLEGRVGIQQTGTFLQVMQEIKELYEVKDYLKAVKDRKNPDKILNMAPKKLSPNYGLIFSLANYANTLDDYIYSILIFKRFLEIDDSVNRDELFTAASTILINKLKEESFFFEITQSNIFYEELADVLSDIPAIADLKL